MADLNSNQPRKPEDCERDSSRSPLQFGIAFLLLVMVITAVTAVGTRWLLTAGERPDLRAAYALVTVAAPTLLVCVASAIYYISQKLFR